jgi:hypothetical protein
MKKYNPNLRITDVAAQLRRIVKENTFMGRDISTPDYRFEIDTPTGGVVTFHQGADVMHIMDYIKREGWDDEGIRSVQRR